MLNWNELIQYGISIFLSTAHRLFYHRHKFPFQPQDKLSKAVPIIINYQNKTSNACWIHTIIANPWMCNDAVKHASKTIKIHSRPHYRPCSSVIFSNLWLYSSTCSRASSPPTGYRPDLPPLASVFHVNIVCNDTLSEHRCYYGLPTKQRSSLPPRP